MATNLIPWNMMFIKKQIPPTYHIFTPSYINENPMNIIMSIIAAIDKNKNINIITIKFYWP